MNKILCPIDFSEASLMALEFATKIADKHSSSLKLIHVITSSEYNSKLGTPEGGSYDSLREEAGAKLSKLCFEIHEVSSNDYDICSYAVLAGDLTDRIVETSLQESMALIVMGTDGVRDIEEERMGSNTVRVITHSKIPVLSVPREASYQDFDRIVYGSELSPDDRNYLQLVINFAIPFDSAINVVHVSRSPEKNQENFMQYVDDLKSYLDYPKLEVEEFETSESISLSLEHTLNLHNANLLVLVHRSRNKLKNLFHQSLTKKMSYLTNFPLLALRN